MSVDNSLVIAGSTMPTPKKDGIVVSKEKIWAPKTGRGADGTMLGDLVAIKYKLQITWPPLSAVDCATIDSAISGGFFSVIFTDPATNTRKSITAYAGAPSYTIYSYVNGYRMTSGVQVDLIEQ